MKNLTYNEINNPNSQHKIYETWVSTSLKKVEMK